MTSPGSVAAQIRLFLEAFAQKEAGALQFLNNLAIKNRNSTYTPEQLVRLTEGQNHKALHMFGDEEAAGLES